MRRYLCAALIAFSPIPALAAPPDDFRRLLDDHWSWAMRESPLYAATLGEGVPRPEIDDVSLDAADRRAAAAAAFLTRLEAIPDAALSEADRGNKGILRRMLAEQIEANGFGQRMILFNSFTSMHQWFAGLGEQLPLRRKADYLAQLGRFERFPATNDEIIAVSRKAIAGGFVQPCAAVAGFDRTISGVITSDPAASRFYAPFKGARPVDMTDTEWSAMQARAKALISGTLNPAYASFDRFYRTEYAPKCSTAVGISAQPGGAAYYAFRVRQETTTDLTPDAIHAIGLSEVARIAAEMDTLAGKAGHASRAAFIRDLRTNPKYYATSADELMRHAALQAKRIDGKMPGLFGRLARLPYGVRAIPAETAEGTTTAYYSPGSPDAGIAGFFNVNTSKLDQRPLWELPALTAHEAVPGHHQQIALQQELDLPKFRHHLASFTAFVEGWGLYAERLGIEMGLYDTPEKDMGRLSYEMWRACRLVVDTGIHAKGWSKAQAVAYMTEHTALSAANIEAEVNRYIGWPGQALAYKTGELRIRALRARRGGARRTVRPAALPRRGAGAGGGAARRARAAGRAVDCGGAGEGRLTRPFADSLHPQVFVTRAAAANRESRAAPAARRSAPARLPPPASGCAPRA